MNRIPKSFTAVSLCAAVLTSVTMPAAAREPVIKQDLASGPNVYRVEIRNLTRLEVLEAGDSDGVGELNELTIQLQSFNPNGNSQYDGEKYTGTELYSIKEGGIIGGRRNFPIRVGQHVKTTNGRQRSDATQMWVHAYSNPDDPGYRSQSYSNAGRVELSIYAEELDCVGQRVCGRRSRGGVTISFRIPEFSTRPSHRCGPENTFRLEKLDGELQISGLEGTDVSSYASSRTLLLGVDYKKGGPRLQPFNADICIASTTRAPAIRKPTNIERDLARPQRRPR